MMKKLFVFFCFSKRGRFNRIDLQVGEVVHPRVPAEDNANLQRRLTKSHAWLFTCQCIQRLQVCVRVCIGGGCVLQGKGEGE